MDLKNLQSNKDKLFTHMYEAGYSKHYISDVRSMINQITCSPLLENCENYLDVLDKIVLASKKGYSQSRIKFKKCVLSIIYDYDIHGILPNARVKNNEITPRNNSFTRLNSRFRFIVNFSGYVLQNRNVKPASVEKRRNVLSSFLDKVQKLGINDLGGITQEVVIEILTNPDGTAKFKEAYIRELKRAFKDCFDLNLREIYQIWSYVPAIKRTRKTPQFLTEEEKKVLITYLESGSISLRDRAVIYVLLDTGLRASDVADLTLNSIDWTKNSIETFQNKNDQYLQLPLSTRCGNAIYDYVTSERGSSNYRNLFLLSGIYENSYKFSRYTVNSIVSRCFKACGLRQNKGQKKGPHIFRSTLATDLLNQNTPLPEIAEILGHSDTVTTQKAYLGVDYEKLKQFSLPISCFELRPGKVVD